MLYGDSTSLRPDPRARSIGSAIPLYAGFLSPLLAHLRKTKPKLGIANHNESMIFRSCASRKPSFLSSP
jgi:hypothetical protein